jgi:poly(A) polymerase
LKAKEIWLVGGACRDKILGKEVKDFDFVIKGNAVEFAKEMAKKWKGVLVILDEKNDEARVIIKKELTFDFTHMTSIEEDLERRDFKMNAIAIKLDEKKVFDPYEGEKEIKKKRITMIKEKNIQEDPLRILRGFRFGIELGFRIEENTYKIFEKYKKLLKKVSPERIRIEFFKILENENSYIWLKKMRKINILQEILPELYKMNNVPQGKPYGDLLSHLILTVKEVEKNSYLLKMTTKEKGILKLSALLHDIGKPYTLIKGEDEKVHFYGHERKGVELVEGSISKHLRLSNYEVKFLQTLLQYHMRPHLLASEEKPTDKAIWRLIRDGKDFSMFIFLLAYADALASGGKGSKEVLDLFFRAKKIFQETRRPKFKPLINGYDLINMGFKPSPLFKEILNKITTLQVTKKITSKQEAINYVKKHYPRE